MPNHHVCLLFHFNNVVFLRSMMNKSQQKLLSELSTCSFLLVSSVCCHLKIEILNTFWISYQVDFSRCFWNQIRLYWLNRQPVMCLILFTFWIVFLVKLVDQLMDLEIDWSVYTFFFFANPKVQYLTFQTSNRSLVPTLPLYNVTICEPRTSHDAFPPHFLFIENLIF